jgi:hypothetical protein
MHRISIHEAKQRFRIPELWYHLGFAGKPNTSCCCPWRVDHNPSFSVSNDGLLWHDFGTGEGGDAVDFLQRASGLSKKDACRKFIELAEGRCPTRSDWNTWEPKLDRKPRPIFPNSHKGNAEELLQLAKLRKIGLEGLQFASERELLWFAILRGQLRRHPSRHTLTPMCLFEIWLGCFGVGGVQRKLTAQIKNRVKPSMERPTSLTCCNKLPRAHIAGVRASLPNPL